MPRGDVVAKTGKVGPRVSRNGQLCARAAMQGERGPQGGTGSPCQGTGHSAARVGLHPTRIRPDALALLEELGGSSGSRVESTGRTREEGENISKSEK